MSRESNDSPISSPEAKTIIRIPRQVKIKTFSQPVCAAGEWGRPGDLRERTGRNWSRDNQDISKKTERLRSLCTASAADFLCALIMMELVVNSAISNRCRHDQITQLQAGAGGALSRWLRFPFIVEIQQKDISRESGAYVFLLRISCV